MVKDIECVRKHLQLEQWVVLGHSFGGILAQAYAVRHPKTAVGSGARRHGLERAVHRRGFPQPAQSACRQPCVRGSASCERAGIFQANGAYTKRYAAASAKAIAPYMYAKTPPRRFKNPPPLGMEVLREMWVRRSDFRIDGNLKGFDFTKALARVRAPSLVVIGDRDLVSTATADVSRASLPRATLVVMAECAHMMFIDQTAPLQSVAGGVSGSVRRKQRRGRTVMSAPRSRLVLCARGISRAVGEGRSGDGGARL